MISAICLKFVGMINAMKQITILNGHALPIFAHFTELKNFHDIGPGLRDDITGLTL